MAEYQLPEGMEVYKTDSGKWRWNYTSPGGSSHISPKPYSSKAIAAKAADSWYLEFVES